MFSISKFYGRYIDMLNDITILPFRTLCVSYVSGVCKTQYLIHVLCFTYSSMYLLMCVTCTGFDLTGYD